ncbi:Toxoplasma gondii family B protein [Toxoplasma gondii GAB2-2007-GAL-DOM2]|uniref:Toxoplasma gondii family B protein n=6 Tax=Toxoplasma gondii TaxID=5811 RepID=V4Z2P0_TOXGV|nr:Toxoplasma gondii family B protein [Toxoplasma gondii VEG]KFG27822.1 Toxoplasma gondii family B protein [Toxoplasma gondii p89]KFG29391.1 Toxoplasma gondii family B protein [Toxoplasma gondii GAB2-2007-GAL-DOM2]KFH00813.1 Toxoplasma gondii family B protein [Toxoplasma gondii MAS]PUA83361.1 Toxoplasma gondii family B protein [Toxoplasma gondii TgCATBr9]
MALFIGVLCALSCCSIESRAMTTGEVTSSAPAVTTGAAHAGVENDSLTALRKLRRSRQSPSQKRTAVISGKRLATVTTAAVLLTAVVGMLMASGKLRQCLHAMMNQTGGEIEGNKKRRLAEGNDESDKCRCVNATEDRVRVEPQRKVSVPSRSLGQGGAYRGCPDIGERRGF